jgi:hypothetical protein
MTPHRYVRARRFELARKLLVVGPTSVTQICMAAKMRL